MSHRPEDNYPYVAVNDIMSGMTRAFSAGDPVPADTVEALGLLDSGDVIHRDEFAELKAAMEGEPAPEKTQPAKRGEMPPHLVSADAGSSRAKTKTAAGAKTDKAAE